MFDKLTYSTPNFNLPMLYEMAERFGFKVDTRGIYPTMIMGQKAARYTTHRDALNFIGVSMNFVSPSKYSY